jgi:predicted nucleic acid-binding protein
MRKLKLYLDTSVISHLEQPEKQYEQNITLLFWERVLSGDYDIVVSDVVWRELRACTIDEKRKTLERHLSEIEYTEVTSTDNSDIQAFARLIIDKGFLPEKSKNDALHIAASLVSVCDYIVTWNFHHLANVETNENIRSLSIAERLPQIGLITPLSLLSKTAKGG